MYRNATEFEVNTSSISSIHNVPVPPPSTFPMAKAITNFNEISYPEGIQSPDPNLMKDGLLRYDRFFLLQFMEVCKVKPEELLDLVGKVSFTYPSFMPETVTEHLRTSYSASIPDSPISNKSYISNASGFPLLGLANSSKFMYRNATEFEVNTSSISSIHKVPVPPPSTFPMAKSITNFNEISYPEGIQSPDPNLIKDGLLRYDRPFLLQFMEVCKVKPKGSLDFVGNVAFTYPSFTPETVTEHLRTSYSASNPDSPISSKSYISNASGSPLLGPGNSSDRKVINIKDPEFVLVDRKVKALLNKLSMEKFDSISDQIVEWVNKSKDCKTLMQVIALVFDMALDEATSEIYARLCRKMMEKLSPTVKDESITLQDGKPIAGGQLLRKYLLNRCQEEFEHGWAVKEAMAAVAAKKAPATNEKKGNTEVSLYSDEYYAAHEAKLRGLGLIKFIGELFKLQMLTERIMHMCLKKLLGNVDQPEEEDLESCCKLLMTIGSMLDTTKSANHMAAYFLRIAELRNSTLVSPRVQFMLQDVLDLREKKWISRNVVAAPSTIAQVHENAAKEKAAREKDVYNRRISMSSGGNREDYPQVGPDGWAVGGGGAGNAPRPPSKAGDLSNFGKINKNTSMSFGLSTVFTKKDGDNKRECSVSDMFPMLSQGDASPAESKVPLPRRKLLVPVPRMKSTADEAAVQPESETKSEAEPSPVEMTKERAIKKITKDMEEFFAVRNLDNAEMYLTDLPVIHHFRLVHQFTSHAIEAKEAEVQLLVELFNRAVEKDLVSSNAFEAGFLPIAATIHDVVIYAPRAFRYFSIVVKSAGLDDKRKARLASRVVRRTKAFLLL